jgi:hypothetical protein
MVGLRAFYALLIVVIAGQMAFLGFPIQARTAFAELQIAEATERFALNSTSQPLEIRVSSEQAFQPLAVMMSLNATSPSSGFSVREVLAYDAAFNSYPIGFDQSALPENSTAVMLNREFLPTAVPAAGAVGIIVAISDALGATLDVTALSIADNQVPVKVEIDSEPTLPLDILENSTIEIEGNSSSDVIRVDNGFADPEIHCETCTRVEFRPDSTETIEVSFVANGTDLGKAQKLTFWAMGDGNVTFSAAGRSSANGTVSYSESIALSLDDEWQRTELDISESELDNITHLFGFSVQGAEAQTFYIKGAMFS